VVSVAGIILGTLGLVQAYIERRHLRDDLDRRARVLARALVPQVQRLAIDPSSTELESLAEHLSGSSRTLGVLLCLGDRVPLATSARIEEMVPCTDTRVKVVLEGQDSDASWTFDDAGHVIHAFATAVPLKANGSSGALVVLHDASYIDRRIASQLVWFAAGLALLGLVLTVTTVTSVRVIFGRPLDALAEWMRRLRLDEADGERLPPSLPSQSLAMESERLAASLRAARTSAQALARQSTDGEQQWTRERLGNHVLELLDGAQLVVVSNREPYMHQWEHAQVRVITPASGLVTALDPLLRACGGLWIAHGAGDADQVTADSKGRLVVPPDEPRYTMRRIWLSHEEEGGYYYGFSNEGFWPLCHATHERPQFRQGDWNHYVTANERFATAVLDEVGSRRAVVLVQDYHLALVPRLLKRKRPDIAISLFWHIPWPNPEAFRICPWKTEILQGMLGADLISFHAQYHCNNFLDTVDRTLEVRVDWEHFGVWQGGNMTHVRPFPISVQPWHERNVPKGDALETKLKQLRHDYKLDGKVVALGVDRIDYTKGIPDRIRAIARFLEMNPDWMGRFVFVELGAPSRTHIKRYRDLVTEVEALADDVNWKFQREGWKPIIVLHEHHSPETVYTWMRLAEICIVSSLHDGMNLVAKEFVAARDNEDAVLILSEFTGAARELVDAILINPYATEEFAEAIHRAIEMPAAERRMRMKRLRRQVEGRNVYGWARDLISQTTRAGRGAGGGVPQASGIELPTS
jgi:trehalose 6-phosphate synthase